jgi:hypothetical protein
MRRVKTRRAHRWQTMFPFHKELPFTSALADADRFWEKSVNASGF